VFLNFLPLLQSSVAVPVLRLWLSNATVNLACSLQFNPGAAKCMAADDVFAGGYIFLHERESKATGFRSLLIRQNKGAFT